MMVKLKAVVEDRHPHGLWLVLRYDPQGGELTSFPWERSRPAHRELVEELYRELGEVLAAEHKPN